MAGKPSGIGADFNEIEHADPVVSGGREPPPPPPALMGIMRWWFCPSADFVTVAAAANPDNVDAESVQRPIRKTTSTHKTVPTPARKYKS